MSDSDDDPGADLSKKERLINAWIAVGPEGKTTDVSDLTGSSRGYASDIRRSMAGDEEDEEQLPFEEIEDAHDPDLVEQYRSDLADDAVDGHWPFTDRLTGEETDDETESPGPVTGEPVSRSRAGPSSAGSAPQPQDSGRNVPSQPRQQPPKHSPEQPRQSPQRPPPQSPRESPQRPHHQAPQQSPEGPSGRSPQQPPQQSPQPSPHRAPQQPPQQSARHPQQHSPGHGEPGSEPAAGPPGGQAPAQSQSSAGGQPRQARQSVQSPQSGGHQRTTQPARTAEPVGFRDRLADLDRQLIAQQQQATAELDSLPQGSQAHAIAISKYNLVVDVRQSLRQLANFAPGP